MVSIELSYHPNSLHVEKSQVEKEDGHASDPRPSVTEKSIETASEYESHREEDGEEVTRLRLKSDLGAKLHISISESGYDDQHDHCSLPCVGGYRQPVAGSQLSARGHARDSDADKEEEESDEAQSHQDGADGEGS